MDSSFFCLSVRSIQLPNATRCVAPSAAVRRLECARELDASFTTSATLAATSSGDFSTYREPSHLRPRANSSDNTSFGQHVNARATLLDTCVDAAPSDAAMTSSTILSMASHIEFPISRKVPMQDRARATTKESAFRKKRRHKYASASDTASTTPGSDTTLSETTSGSPSPDSVAIAPPEQSSMPTQPLEVVTMPLLRARRVSDLQVRNVQRHRRRLLTPMRKTNIQLAVAADGDHGAAGSVECERVVSAGEDGSRQRNATNSRQNSALPLNGASNDHSDEDNKPVSMNLRGRNMEDGGSVCQECDAGNESDSSTYVKPKVENDDIAQNINSDDDVLLPENILRENVPAKATGDGMATTATEHLAPSTRSSSSKTKKKKKKKKKRKTRTPSIWETVEPRPMVPRFPHPVKAPDPVAVQTTQERRPLLPDLRNILRKKPSDTLTLPPVPVVIGKRVKSPTPERRPGLRAGACKEVRRPREESMKLDLDGPAGRYATYGYLRVNGKKEPLPLREKVAAILQELEHEVLIPICRHFNLRYHFFEEAHCQAKKAGVAITENFIVRKEPGETPDAPPVEVVGRRTTIRIRIRVHPSKGDPKTTLMSGSTLRAILLHEIAHLRVMNHGKSFMLFLKQVFQYAAQTLGVFAEHLPNEIPSPWPWENLIYEKLGNVSDEELIELFDKHRAQQKLKEADDVENVADKDKAAADKKAKEPAEKEKTEQGVAHEDKTVVEEKRLNKTRAQDAEREKTEHEVAHKEKEVDKTTKQGAEEKSAEHGAAELENMGHEEVEKEKTEKMSEEVVEKAKASRNIGDEKEENEQSKGETEMMEQNAGEGERLDRSANEKEKSNQAAAATQMNANKVKEEASKGRTNEEAELEETRNAQVLASPVADEEF